MQFDQERKWSERLFAEWKKKPSPVDIDKVDGGYKDILTRGNPSGFPGPVLTGPLPDSVPIYSKREMREANINLPRRIAQQALDQGFTEIVFVYPVSFRNLDRLSAIEPDKRTEAEIMGLDVGLTLLELYNETVSQVGRRGGNVSTLPVFKLTENSSVAAPIAPVRFWSLTKPRTDALFVIMDDIVEKGRTIAAIYALLKEYGVPDNHISCIFARQKEVYKPIHLTPEQRYHIAELREQDPAVAARTDYVLSMIGIDRMEALFAKEALHLGIDGTSSPETVDKVVEQRYVETISQMPAIPEADETYLERLSKAGYRTVRSR